MTEKRLDGEKISPILIEMRTESMAEGMTGKPSGPAETVLMGMDMTGKVEGVYRFVRICLLMKEESHRPSALKPVLRKTIEGILRHDSVAVFPGFG